MKLTPPVTPMPPPCRGNTFPKGLKEVVERLITLDDVCCTRRKFKIEGIQTKVNSELPESGVMDQNINIKIRGNTEFSQKGGDPENFPNFLEHF